tara:strand:- start:195 stop:1190 length:996 start_codon:yes stop_codon:yes gene_type:complete
MSTIVHIGLGKTATTSLQENVFPEIPRLRKEIKYNEREIRHSIKKLWFLNNNNDEELNFQKKILEQKHFISLEYLVNWNPRNWEKTADLNLRLFGKNATIIITARETESYLRSIYQQRIHEGNICLPEEFLINKDDYNKLEPFLSQKILTHFDVDSYDLEKLWHIYNSRFSKVYLVPVNSIHSLEFLREIFDLNENEIKNLRKYFKKKRHNIAYSKIAMKLTMFRQKILMVIGLTPIGSDKSLFDSFNSIFKNKFSDSRAFIELSFLEKITQFPERFIKRIILSYGWRFFMQSFVNKILPYKKYELPENIYRNVELAKKNDMFLSKFEMKK